MPFYLRTGKHMSQRNTEIAIRFKQAPYTAFQDTPVDTLRPNWLVLRIAPDEGISLQFEVKRRGPVVDLAAVKMDFHYDDWFPKEPNVGYETLLYDVMIGDPTLFMRADMVEQTWRIVQPVLDAWTKNGAAESPIYPAGSSGPSEADALLARDGRRWQTVEGDTTDNRHDTRAPVTIQMLGRGFGRRRHVGDRRQDPDAARPGRRGETARKRNHFFDYQQPAAPGLAHAAGPPWNHDAGRRLQWRDNGDFDLAVITEHLLPPEIARRAVDMLDARGVEVWVFGGQDWLGAASTGPIPGWRNARWGSGRQWSKILGLPSIPPPRSSVSARISSLLERCEREMRAALADRATVARSQPYYLDITHPLANKGFALSQIAELLGVPLAEIAAIGDGGNDVAMFERSGLSIAMGNASPEVQQAADFVTDSNSEDGFANAIERFILGGNRSNERVEVARAGDRA